VSPFDDFLRCYKSCHRNIRDGINLCNSSIGASFEFGVVMGTKACIDAAGAVHHIIGRGVNRHAIFPNKKVYLNFIERLGDLLVETKMPCFARALTPKGTVTGPGRYPATVKARSVLCKGAVRELDMRTVELSRGLCISQPTASQSVKRGGRVVAERKLQVPE
jgi:hypothetical protein